MKALKLLAVGLVAIFAASICYLGLICFRYDIQSLGQLRNYRDMRAYGGPVAQAFADQRIVEHDPVERLTDHFNPAWIDDFGRYTVYGFEPKQSYSHMNVYAIDGQIAGASTASCTWGWIFFDSVPDQIEEAWRSMIVLDELVAETPDLAEPMFELRNESRRTLGMPLLSPPNG